ncbi:MULTISPECIES: enoyl-CoA hydratase/isomerase family protein [Rossellomorea]|jgi:2-(1,2-epoxy-1,2-dihydrophenyl)acetyl-CoA isomerase|uniref:enoyl-CoA hydratase/isomerase family protein n=1 Tax=Rossellomorea TaxID=2837508 RepID=UPI0011E8F101|nr:MULTISPECIES: enoyl-CoA hydratase [Rossellomorea]MDT9024293.1 enoyl-CoA hydratase [Rossellomorea sp. YC4-1]TYS91588.1 enoyl-CoA hydratase [Rossellomorea aquimaris]
MKSSLLLETTDRVLTLTLNRPDSLNSFDENMLTGIVEALKQADHNQEIRAIVIRGAGRAFSAGGDVKTMGSATSTEVYEHIGILNTCIKAIKEIEKPVIASVHGFAAGAGFNLALACDLIIASEDSQFALSFSKVGLISDGGGSYFLPRIIGPHLAKEFFFSGEPVTAGRLFDLGVLNRIVPSENLDEETTDWAVELASGPSKAYGMMKKMIDRSFTLSLDEILEQERITQTLLISTEDHAEGVSAFKDKRRPTFTGK